MSFEWNGNRDPYKYDEYFWAGHQYRFLRTMPKGWVLEPEPTWFDRLMKYLWGQL
jgi:hypothetical protein